MNVLIHESMVKLKGSSNVWILAVNHRARNFRQRAHYGSLLVVELIEIIILVIELIILGRLLFSYYGHLLLLNNRLIYNLLNCVVIHFLIYINNQINK